MNYGEDELGSFGDENEIKVSQRGVSLVVVPSNVSIQMNNWYFLESSFEVSISQIILVHSIWFSPNPFLLDTWYVHW